MILSLNDWYEDLEELEDAVGGSFEEFLRAMPQFEVRKNEAGKAEFTVLQVPRPVGRGRTRQPARHPPSPAGPRAVWSLARSLTRVARAPCAAQPDDDAPPTILTFTVRTREDLWRVLYKSPHAELRFPSNEFAIGADSKRRIDSIYNHMTAAVWNLSQHLRGQAQQGGAVPDETAAGIERTVDELNKMLDVEEPFDIVVRRERPFSHSAFASPLLSYPASSPASLHALIVRVVAQVDDPTGVSSFKPSDGVDVQEM